MALTAKDIMTTQPLIVSPETPLTEVVRIMLEHHFNGLPVVNAQGELLGVICQSDLVQQQKTFSVPSFFMILDGFVPLQSTAKMEEEIHRMSAVNAGQLMTPGPRFVTPDASVDSLASLMVDEKYYTLPVVDGGKLVGVVGKEDLLRAMLR